MVITFLNDVLLTCDLAYCQISELWVHLQSEIIHLHECGEVTNLVSLSFSDFASDIFDADDVFFGLSCFVRVIHHSLDLPIDDVSCFAELFPHFLPKRHQVFIINTYYSKRT